MTLLAAHGISVSYRGERRTRRVLENVSIELAPGEALGVMGESGCGKSTLIRALVGLEPIDSGSIMFEGAEIARGGARRAFSPSFARTVQFVFQDPVSALNPRLRNWDSATESAALLEGLSSPRDRRALAARLFAQTGLSELFLDGYPHALSGGQRQRLALCRALAVSPRLLILDEPTSALDLPVQARVLDLLLALNLAGVALLLVSHDAAVIRHLCTRVAIMREGQICESGSIEQVFTRPRHAYSRALIEASSITAGRSGLC